MITAICMFCHKEVSKIYIGLDSKGNREYYICSECLKNKISPEMMKRLDDEILNGRDADADMRSVSQASDDNDSV